MKLALAAGAALLLAIAAFRRARGVLSPGPRESVARPAEGGAPPGLTTSTLVTAAMVGAGVAVVIGIMWVGLELLT